MHTVLKLTHGATLRPRIPGSAEDAAVGVEGGLAAQVGVQDGGVPGNVSASREVDEACHGLSFIHRVDDHALEAPGEQVRPLPDRCSLSRMTTDSGPAGQDGLADPAATLADRLFHDMIGALELFTVYLGERLGLYRALAADGPATSTELARRTGTTERYVREWLEHHAASGLLEVDDPAVGPLARRYRLPPAHVPVLADPDDVRYRAYNGVEIARAGRWLPQLVEAFRTGGAPPPLPWAPEGRAEYNRATFLNLLGTRWLPAIPEVHRRLRREPPARMADLACGTGWSSIAMAQAYPLMRVDGFDLDAGCDRRRPRLRRAGLRGGPGHLRRR